MDIPRDAIAFNQKFSSEQQCLDLLEGLRWPRGFVCPNCDHDDGYRISTRRVIQCVLCRKQTSVTAGTIFHKTRIPLIIWFYIIFLMTSDKGGVSSTRLADQLHMRQKTAWFILHKLRTAMGQRDALIKLAGFVEMDEAVLGPQARRPTTSKEEDPFPRARYRGRLPKPGNKRKVQTDVLVLVEQEKNHAGFVAMKVLQRVGSEDIREALERRVDKFQYIKTDGFHAHHHALRNFPCQYDAIPCGGERSCVELPVVHRVISLLKNFLMGTYFGIAKKYVQPYLDEFAFRFNRRDAKHPLWLSLLRACVSSLPVCYSEVIA